jgi:hypothetical protein
VESRLQSSKFKIQGKLKIQSSKLQEQARGGAFGTFALEFEASLEF